MRQSFCLRFEKKNFLDTNINPERNSVTIIQRWLLNSDPEDSVTSWVYTKVGTFLLSVLYWPNAA